MESKKIFQSVFYICKNIDETILNYYFNLSKQRKVLFLIEPDINEMLKKSLHTDNPVSENIRIIFPYKLIADDVITYTTNYLKTHTEIMYGRKENVNSKPFISLLSENRISYSQDILRIMKEVGNPNCKIIRI